MDMIEKKASELGDRSIEIIQSEQQRGKKIEKTNSLRNLWDNIKNELWITYLLFKDIYKH